MHGLQIRAIAQKENAPHTKQKAFSTLIFNISKSLQRDPSSPWNEIILIQ